MRPYPTHWRRKRQAADPFFRVGAFRRTRAPDTTLIPPRTQYGATRSKAGKGNPSKYAGFATPDRSLVAGAGKRFESARRLFTTGLDKPHGRNRRSLRFVLGRLPNTTLTLPRTQHSATNGRLETAGLPCGGAGGVAW